MNRTLYIIAYWSFIYLHVSSGFAGQTDNLLQNHDFEQGTAQPEGWSVFAPGSETLVFNWDQGEAVSGEHSVSITNTGSGFGMWQQLVDVTGGEVYQFTAYVGFENIVRPGHCKLQLVFRNAQQDILEMMDFPKHDQTREFAKDFPHALQVRAPLDAVVVEVNLFLTGQGKAKFDNVFFGLAPTGSISGTVACDGTPLEGATLNILGDPWSKTYSTITDADGHYRLEHIPQAFPRYILMASKTGCQSRTQGKIMVSGSQTTTVDFDLAMGEDPLDMLKVKFGTCVLSPLPEYPDLPAQAMIPSNESGYPAEVRDFLQSTDKMESNHPEVAALAQSIISSVQNPVNTRDVAYAVYCWVSEYIDHDGVFDEGTLDTPFQDITSGIWQTLAGSRGDDSAWCHGKNFTDWCYSASELLQVRSGICVEHAILVTSLFRALNIPARPFSGSLEFWAQTDINNGSWFGTSTTKGRTQYREHGTYPTIDTFAHGRLSSFPVTKNHMSHEDWDCSTPGIWRESHPWSESYAATEGGLTQAKSDMASFSETGQAPRPNPPQGAQDRYQINYRDITLGLFDLEGQTKIDVRFPLNPNTDYQASMEHHAYWTNHPECVIETRVETIEAPGKTGGDERWFHIVFDVTSLLDSSKQATPTAIIPHIANPENWNSFLVIDNVGSKTCNASLTLFNQGEQLSLEELTIGAKSRQIITLQEGTWGQLDYGCEDMIVKELFQHKTDHGVAEFQLDGQAARELNFLLPQYVADGLSWAGLTLLNQDSTQTAVVSLTALDELRNSVASTEIEIEPLSREVGLVSDFFAQLDFRELARIHASSSEPLSGIIISGQGNSNLLFTKAVTTSDSGTIIMPHIAGDWSTWENLLVFDNFGLTNAEVTLKLFSQGAKVFEQILQVPHGQNTVMNLNEHAHLNPDCGVIEHVPESLAVRQSYQNHSQGGIAEFLLDGQQASDLVFTLPSTIPSDFNWKGLAFYNLSSTDGAVTLQAWGDSELLQETELNLVANSRKAILSSDLFPDVDMSRLTQIIASSDVEMSGINISGKDQERLLFTKATGITGGSGGDNSSPFAMHGANSIQEEDLVGPPDPNTGFVYDDALELGVKWDRILGRVNYPFDRDKHDRLFGSVPTEIGIVGNLYTPRIPETLQRSVSDSEYKEYVREVVERYDGDGIDDMPGLVNPIKYWQIDNEVPDYLLVQVDGMDPILGEDYLHFIEENWAHYADTMKLADEAIKSACADCKTIISGVVFVPSDYSDPAIRNPPFENRSDVVTINHFYKKVAEELAGKHIDVFDLHIYGRPDGSYKDSKTLYEAYSSFTNEYGYHNAEFWITETASNGPYGFEKEQASDLVKRMLYPLTFGIKKVFWFTTVEMPNHGGTYFDQVGLIFNGIKDVTGRDEPVYGTRKLAFHSFRLLIEKLNGADWKHIETINDGTDNIYAYNFHKTDGSAVSVLWWDFYDDPSYQEGDERTIDLALEHLGSVVITTAVPDAESGEDLDDGNYPDFFQKETKQVVAGSITVTLGSKPVFIERVSK